MKIQIFDPPMCCSTGVCGPSVDPELVQLAADLDRLRRQGIDVERHSLSQEPASFINTPTVRAALRGGGQRLPAADDGGRRRGLQRSLPEPRDARCARVARRAPGGRQGLCGESR